MIRAETFSDMTMVNSLTNLMSISSRDEIFTVINHNYPIIVRDIMPALRKFKSKSVRDIGRSYEKAKTKLTAIQTHSPVWSPKIEMSEYINSVHHYIRRVPDILKLAELNRLQEHVDVKITDPSQSATTHMKYTVGDVFSFLTYGARTPDSKLLVSDPDVNPFWVPFKYQFPEGSLGTQIDAIWKEHDITRVIANFNRMFSIYDDIQDGDRPKAVRAIVALLDFYRRIHALQFDPGFLKKFVPDEDTGDFTQVGPMETYELAHINQILNKFDRAITRKRMGIITASTFEYAPKVKVIRAKAPKADKPDTDYSIADEDAAAAEPTEPAEPAEPAEEPAVADNANV